MVNNILRELKQIEEEYNVKILYACEVGSRAWGLSSTSSDYDVRFLYVHPYESYLSIDPIGTGINRDVIEVPIQDQFDINGWEISKALRLLRKSNPSLLEWLHTPIRYDEAYSTIGQIRKLLPLALNIKTCIRHYINMARGNINKVQKNIEQSDLKLYINILRPTLIALWIQRYQEFPQFNMQQLVHSLITESKVKNLMNELIVMKTSGQPNRIVIFPTLLNYCQEELNRLEMYAKNAHENTIPITDELNAIFRNTLREVFNINFH